MRQHMRWIIPVGCAVVLVCIACVGAAAWFVSTNPSVQQAANLSLFVTPSSLPPTTAPLATPSFTRGNMQDFIQKHNGKTCDTNYELTCVTLSLPLDHTDKTNTKTVDVVFGILPATGERYGMFFQAFPGGPGGAGIASSEGHIDDRIDQKIREHYDIVFFDQRGVGLSSPLDCPKAMVSYQSDTFSDYDKDGVQGPDTPKEQQGLIDGAKTFADACVKEIGIAPDQLKLYDTEQVIEDIESFRQAVGDNKFYLYGVSYGTEVAQIYAAAHPDHLAGLILDGTLDLTLDGAQMDERQIKGFETVLDATLKACGQDPDCKADFGGDDPAKVYDDLAASLSKNPQQFNFPLPDGTQAKRLMTLSKLQSVATYAMYSRAARMVLMRALAAAHRGDFVPLARLLYALLDYDPATEKWVGDPTFSQTDFYVVGCADNNYFTGTPDERAKAIIQENAGNYGKVTRLDESLYSDLACVYWPNSPSQQLTRPPLVAKGVPTFVLNATLDPATPFQGGKDVASRLDNGFHIYVNGGEHGSYGNSEACPDDYVTNFLVSGQLPTQKEITCNWDQAVMWTYLTPAPADVSKMGSNMLAFFYSTDIDIIFIPEHLFSKPRAGKVEVACPYGGKFSFDIDQKTLTDQLTFTACEFTNGFAMTGTGNIDFKTLDRSYVVDISGAKQGHLTYKATSTPQSLSVQGTYGGQNIDLQR